MADSFQNEVPKARINLKLDLHTGGASKKMELPLKLLVAGDFSNGQESAQISEREKVNITKNNFDSVLSEYSPKLNLTVKNTLSDDGGEENVQLTFQSMKDFTPEQVAAQIPEQLTRLRASIVALDMEKQALLEDIAIGNQCHVERLSEIEQEEVRQIVTLDELETQYGQEMKLTEQLRESRQDISRQREAHRLQQELNEMQRSNPLLSLDVDVRTVANVIADWTGVPLSSLMKDEQTELLTLENDIGKRVVGQDVALEAIARRLRAAKTGLTSENGPLGVFLLVGPSGVGKTETALALADVMYGSEKSLITINLSEYQEPHTVSQLKGSPPGYVGYGQGGILTEAVRKRPYSVVLLDEVEKAHRDVMNLFYQVFDRGFMRDGEGREIDFRNTVILMTSNLGSDHLMQLLDEHGRYTNGGKCAVRGGGRNVYVTRPGEQYLACGNEPR